MRLLNFIPIVLFVLVFNITTKATIDKVNNRIQGVDQIIVGEILSTIDNKYFYMSSYPIDYINVFHNEKITNRIRLGIDPAKNWSPSFYYSCEVVVAIKYYDISGSLTKLSNKSLKVDYSPVSGASYKDIDVFEFSGDVKVEIEVLSVTQISGTSISLDNIFIELEVESERYYKFDYLSFPPDPSVQSSVDFNDDLFRRKLINDGNDLLVTWNHLRGSEFYDFEWVFVSEYSTLAVGNDLIYNFDNQATRIRTTGNSFTIPLIYEAGYLLYRIRSVYLSSVGDYKTKHEGRWSNHFAVSDEITALAGNSKYHIRKHGVSAQTTEFEPEKNWSHSMTFGLNNNYANAVSYTDGVGKFRQLVAKSQTNNEVIANSTLYDHYGRPAIEFLPAPIATPSLEYKQSLNRVTGDEFDRADFDGDQSCSERTLALSTTASKGSANYYSTDNPNKEGVEKFLPDAQGFTFIQKEYRQDNSGQVTRVNLPGDQYNYGSKKEDITAYYETVGSGELTDFFATNDYSEELSYTKTVNKDPNMVLTTTLINSSGQVILKKVDGTASENMVSLPSTGYTGPIDLMDFKQKNKPLKVYYKGALTQAGTYELDYSIVGADYTECGICFPCDYEFKIEAYWYSTLCKNVKDDIIDHEIGTGATLLGPPNCTTNGTSFTLNKTNVIPTAANGFDKMEFSISSSDLENAILELVVVKTIIPKNDNLNYYTEYYKDRYCGNGPEYYLIDPDPITCGGDPCLSKFNAKYGKDYTQYNSRFGTSYPNSTAYDIIKTAFLEKCDAPYTGCEQIMDQLRIDFYPGGKYAQESGAPLYGTTDPWAYSVLNPSSFLSYKQPNGTCSAPASYQSFAGMYKTTQGFPIAINSAADYKKHFQREWTDFLITCHPEYSCALRACGYNTNQSGGYIQSPFEFDYLMKNTDGYDKAVALGLLNPINYTTTSGTIVGSGTLPTQVGNYHVKLPSNYGSANGNANNEDQFFTNLSSYGSGSIGQMQLWSRETLARDDMFPGGCSGMPDEYNIWISAYILASVDDLSSCSQMTTAVSNILSSNVFELDNMNCDKDKWWQFFKALYLHERTKIIEGEILVGIGTNLYCADCAIPLGRTIILPQTDGFGTIGAIDLTSNPPNYGSAKLNALLNANTNVTCSNMADNMVAGWLKDLGGCAGLPTQGLMLDDILKGLHGVFTNACMNDGSFGAQQTSVPFTYTTVSLSTNISVSFSTFDEVLQFFITSYVPENCSAMLIRAPSYGTPVGRINFLDECGCNVLAQNKIDYDLAVINSTLPTGIIDEADFLEYNYSLGMDNIADLTCECLSVNTSAKLDETWSSGQLTSLENLKIMVPAGFGCEKCITCEVLENELNGTVGASDEFVDVFPNHATSANYNKLLVQHMNNKFKIDYSSTGFDEFRKSCFAYKASGNTETELDITEEAVDLELLLDELASFKLLELNTPVDLKMHHDIYYSSLYDCAPLKSNKIEVEVTASVGEFQIAIADVTQCINCVITIDEPYVGFDLTLIGSFRDIVPIYPVNSTDEATKEFKIIAVMKDKSLQTLFGESDCWYTNVGRIDNASGDKDLAICSHGIYENGEDGIPDCGNRAYAFSSRDVALFDYNKALDKATLAFRKNFVSACNNPVETFTLSSDAKPAAITLFYYDLHGNVVRTVPPTAVNANAPADHNLDLATEYDYNSLGEKTYEKSPDGGITKYWYDNLGRLVASQNEDQRNTTTGEEYSYIIYDDFGRILETGNVGPAFSPNTGLTDAIARSKTDFFSWLREGPLPGPNLLSQIPRRTEVTKFVYDDISSPAANAMFSATANRRDARYSNFIQDNLYKNLASKLYFEEMNAEPIISGNDTYYNYKDPGEYDKAVHYSYDAHGNVEYYIQDNKEMSVIGPDQQFKFMHYEYDLLTGMVTKMSYQEGESDQLLHKYDYDADGRLNEVYVSTNGKIWNREADYKFYRNGWLARKELSQHKVQGLDFAYTTQGWLKGINSSSLKVNRDAGQDGANGSSYYSTENQLHHSVSHDAFGLDLIYNTGDYDAIGHGNMTNNDYFLASIAATPIGSNFDGATYNNQYGGNIGGMSTAIMDLNNDMLPHQFRGFKYDVLYRLREMQNYNVTNLPVDNDFSSAIATDDYAVELEYTTDGDITSLVRNAHSNSSNQREMDDLYYQYPQAGTNHSLGGVLDAQADIWNVDILQGQTNTNYLYNDIGQLMQDQSINVDQSQGGFFEWSHTGKLKQLRRSDGVSDPNMVFEYGPDDRRWTKVIKPKDCNNDLRNERYWKKQYHTYDLNGNIVATYRQQFVWSPYLSYCLSEGVERAHIFKGSWGGTDIHGGVVLFNAMMSPNQKAQMLADAINVAQTIPNFNAEVVGDCIRIYVDECTEEIIQDYFVREYEIENWTEAPLVVGYDDQPRMQLILDKHDIYGNSREGVIQQNKLIAEAGMNYTINSEDLSFDIDYGSIVTTTYGKKVVFIYDNPSDIAQFVQPFPQHGINMQVNGIDIFDPDFDTDMDDFYNMSRHDQLQHLADLINNGGKGYVAVLRFVNGIEVLIVESIGELPLGVTYNLEMLPNTILSIDQNDPSSGSSSGPLINLLSYSNEVGKRRYELTNHLGNVIEVVSDRRTSQSVYSPTSIATFNNGTDEGFVGVNGNSPTYSLTIPRNKKLLVGGVNLGFASGSYVTPLAHIEKNYTLLPNTKYKLEYEVTGGNFQNFTWRVTDGSTILVSNWQIQNTDPENLVFITTNGAVKVEFEAASVGNTCYYTLDNVKLSQSSSLDDVIAPDVLSYTDYYPFGMAMPGRQANPTEYMYGFNGMERDDEIKGSGNAYTTEFRGYDPRLGKWLSVDPLAHVAPGWTPYRAFYDNPIMYTDPTGMLEDYYQNEAGEVKWFDNTASEITDKDMATWSNVGTSYASFDGNSLDLHYQNTDSKGNISPASFSVPAVSGRPDGNGNFDYSQTRQEQVGVGPLPAGNYKINSAGIQNLSLGDDIIGTAGAFTQLLGKKVGAWPGGNYSWGMSRLDITPKSVGINGVLRSGFTIHGGQEAGSAGCIDCMRSETLFFDKLQKYSSGSTLLKVDYSKLLGPISSPFNSNGTGFK